MTKGANIHAWFSRTLCVLSYEYVTKMNMRIDKEQSLDFLYSLDLRVFVLNYFIDTDDIYFFMMHAHTEVVGR